MDAAAAEAARQQAHSEYDELVERQRYSRLKFLLDKTTLYSNFLATKLEEQQRQRREKLHRAEEKRREKEAADQTLTDGASADDAVQTRVTTRYQANPAAAAPQVPAVKRTHVSATPPARKRDEQYYNLADYLTAEDVAKRRKSEPMPAPLLPAQSADQTKLLDEDVSERQPKLITGGVLREYQLAGVEWLVSLYENGLNGILADEMGLGKTVQCIAFLAYLREREVHGPFLIVAPLSTVTNWVSEFKRFAPAIPVLLYHGSIEERGKLRSRRMVQSRGNAVGEQFPVIVTSYEIVMNDRKHLQRYRWKYIIVDEGHRIKNLNCKLIRELKSYHSANRLLLTGTPLQNNLAELWSLLNFLLPDIFDDLDSFQSWFDFSDVHREGGDSKIIEAEEKNQIVTKLHHILQPFLLRRLKNDVEKSLPKKREYLVYAPLTPAQREYYSAIVSRDLRSFLLQKEVALAAGASATDVLGAEADGDDSTASNSTNLDEEAFEGEQGEVPMDVQVDGESVSAFAQILRQKERKNYKESGLGQMQTDFATSSTAKFVTEEERRVNDMSLQNLMMQLRKACNHPYLFTYPVKEDGFELLIDENIVRQSGKMLLLDRLLSELLARGHKVLIFSQMTKMLDILGDYLTLRGVAYCRIDGSICYADRAQQISDFNSKPDVKVFILSTRAGGLGINLTAADTCIIYDSDWNPQMDLQAQDRLHRIGQTKPVIVYRLCTAATAEEHMLQKATAKRRLEKLVIHKGKFKHGMSEAQMMLGDLAEILRSHDNQKISTTASGGVISDADLNMILDRSEEAFASFDLESTSFKVLEEPRSESNDALATLGSAASTVPL